MQLLYLSTQAKKAIDQFLLENRLINEAINTVEVVKPNSIKLR